MIEHVRSCLFKKSMLIFLGLILIIEYPFSITTIIF